jgi:phytoene/squalene synthetase
MDYGHARRFATREARRLAGDLYPGPVLMPRGLLRALDPVLAVSLGPAAEGREAFESSFEAMLRGRPDGPLLLALWGSMSSGELPHEAFRRLVALMPTPMPQAPVTRGELLAWLHPRASLFARITLCLAQRDEAEALPPAERLACGFVVTRLLVDLPTHLAQGRILLPRSDMEAVGLRREELLDMVRTPAVDAFLAQECIWARDLLRQGLPVCEKVGARLRRGLRAAVLRSEMLLRRVRDPRRDIFRRPPTLTPHERWRCAVGAWRPLRAKALPEAVEATAAPLS